jgi:hypothetical protein
MLLRASPDVAGADEQHPLAAGEGRLESVRPIEIPRPDLHPAGREVRHAARVAGDEYQVLGGDALQQQIERFAGETAGGSGDDDFHDERLLCRREARVTSSIEVLVVRSCTSILGPPPVDGIHEATGGTFAQAVAPSPRAAPVPPGRSRVGAAGRNSPAGHHNESVLDRSSGVLERAAF